MVATPRILGVDDSLTIRKALEIMLKPTGYELVLAADGAEAIAKANALQPALILLDFILPDMRGTDVCRQLTANPDTARIPVVLISAKGAEIEQAYRDISNVVSYIAKPFKPSVLTALIAEVLAKAAAGDLVKLATPAQDGQAMATPPPQLVAAEAEPTPLAAREGMDAESVDAPGAHGALVHQTELAAGGNGQQVLRDELDDAESVEETVTPAIDAGGVGAATRRERVEWMFETLRSGLEGVYVEEVDTPTGAAADQAKTYTDLIEQLSQQLDEGLHHAQSGARYRLYGDGSIRSLDEALLDVFRRSCRLLLRAAVAGTVSHEPAPHAHRTLMVCHRNSRVHGQLQSLLAAHPEWPVVIVTENFRQLPMLVRLYGPTLTIAEVTWSGALWDQLRVIQHMPEAQHMRVMGIADAVHLARSKDMDATAYAALLVERGITVLSDSAFDAEEQLMGLAASSDQEPASAPAQGEFAIAV